MNNDDVELNKGEEMSLNTSNSQPPGLRLRLIEAGLTI